MTASSADSAVFTLSHFQHYACHHRGECCRAGWVIPVDLVRQPLLGHTRLEPLASGACQFLDETAHRCSVHRRHGEAALPVSCHDFPRVSLVDPRGMFITLSHFCPTVADCLFTDGNLGIVAHPPAFARQRPYDALDARSVWPPLISPSVLFDLPAYARWERYLVDVLAGATSAIAALHAIAAAAERVRRWTPASCTLDSHLDVSLNADRAIDAVETASARYDIYAGAPLQHLQRLSLPIEGARALPGRTSATAALDDLFEHARASRLADTLVPPLTARGDLALRRYLAGRAFGSWTAYQGRGVRTQVAELFFAHDIVRAIVRHQRAHDMAEHEAIANAVRLSDLWLVHRVDRRALLSWLGEAEHAATPRMAAPRHPTD